MSYTPSAADFENLPDSRLTLLHGDKQLALNVVKVRRLPAHAYASEPFVVTLRDNGAHSSLAQGSYRYEHPAHGVLELFTVPIGPDGQGMAYEITFN
jgi:hypothetical protein